MTNIDSYRILEQVVSSEKSKYLTCKAEKNGTPPDSGSFTLFPSGKGVQLKKKLPLEDSPFFRLELKGLSASDIRKGAFLVPSSYGAVEGKKALVVWKGTPPDSRGYDLKIRDLPSYTINSRVSSSKKERVSQISGREPFLQLPGRIYRLELEGQGSECVLLMAEPFTPDQAKQMIKRVNKFGNFPGSGSIYSMNLRVRGYVYIPEEEKDLSFDGAFRKGNWYIMSRLCDKWTGTIEKRARSEAGIKESGLGELLDCPVPLVQVIVDGLIEKGRIFRNRGYLINASDSSEQFLSPMTRAFWEDLKLAGTEGIGSREIAASGRSDLPEILQRRGLARMLDTLLLSEVAYGSLVDQILSLLPKDRSFDLSDLTTVSDLSRSRLIQILDEMEKDGVIRPCGDNRRELV